MGQRKIDRQWPQPRNTRHVWVLGEDRLTPPVQGLVIAWSRHSYQWSALVVRVVQSGPRTQVVQDWLPIDRLRPVRSDLNHVLSYSAFTERLRPAGNRKP